MTLHGPLKNFKRIISNIEIYQSMGILKINNIYQLELGKIMHPAHNNKLPEAFNKPVQTH